MNKPTAGIILLEIVAQENSRNRHSGARGTPTERANGEIGGGAGPFYLQAVIEQGYRAAEVAAFLHYDPSNISRALQKDSSS